jgi:TPR repeat protein
LLPRIAAAIRVSKFLIVAACWIAGSLMSREAYAERVEGRRAALVIGNSAYQGLTPLPNAVKDARRIGDVLSKANFEVTIGDDLDKASLEKTVREFLRSLNDGDVALFYYSGHAIQVAGENFILPVDARLSSSYDLEVESYNVSNLLDYMRETSSLQILILDSCRDNPFRSEFYFKGDKKVAVAGNKGLASLTPRQGSLIVYSTAPDQVAYDGAGELSPFTEALAEHILTPNTEVRQVLTDIRSDVIARTSGRQVPWDVSSLTSQFYFVTQQNLLVMGESLTEIRVSPQTRRIALDIPAPVASGGMVLTARFDQPPKSGALMLGDEKIGPETAIGMDRLQDVVYQAEPGSSSVELIPYSIASADGHKVNGAVAIVFDPAIAPPGDQSEVPVAAAGESAEPSESTDEPLQIALAANVGTGFLTISDAMPLKEQMQQGWYRVDQRSPAAQIALGSRMLSEGDLVKSEDVAQLTVRPSLRIVDTDAKIVLEPVGRSVREAPLVIQVNATVNGCDEQAGDPLDIQGVVEGVYPNDIRLDEALVACQEAVKLFPEVARFKHQLGRVLYARGHYDAAVEHLRGALDAGHVRSGYLLGRLHQLGGPLGRDPARAIPLFEAGAQRGDSYAQHALGRALVEGVGTKPDIQRGIELLTQAAEAGHTYAMNALGTEYLNGNRVEKDAERALRFFEESADRTDVYGLLNLGVLYRDGVGVEQDLDRARELFNRAHEGGHPRAGTVIGLLRRTQDADAGELLGWFRESGARGDAWGAFHAANILKDNPALQQENGEMIRLLGLSASHQTPDVSERAKQALTGVDNRSVVEEIQRTLVRMGQDVGSVDGMLGTRSRQAVAAVLGGAAPGDERALLIELLRKEWIDSRPRLDMLG